MKTMRDAMTAALLIGALACGGGEEGPRAGQGAGTETDPAATLPEAQKSGAYIEYTVSGDYSVTDREEEVVMCSEVEGGLKAHTLGAWNVTLEATGRDPGTHAARITVAAPQQVTELHDDDFRTDDRFYGDGSVTIEEGGRDAFGLPAVKVTYSGTNLESDTGHVIGIEGSLFCGVM